VKKVLGVQKVILCKESKADVGKMVMLSWALWNNINNFM
jgi:hypothetical protein